MTALEFHKDAFKVLYEINALVVLARGLGALTLLRKLIAVYCEPSSLGFVLNLEPEEQQMLVAELGAEGVRFLPRVIATDEGMTAAQREKIYAQGGVVFLSSRSLVTDLLQRRVPAHALQAVLVWHAHSVKVESLEALALRLVRGLTSHVLVTAFTENAEAVTGQRAERLMRALTVNKIELYPRFRFEVKAVLEARKCDVTKLTIDLTPLAARLQERLMDAMKAVLGELRFACPGVDTSLFSVEKKEELYFVNGRVHAGLEAEKLTAKAKHLMSELLVLKRLLHYLPRYDAISFMRFFDAVRREAMATGADHWLYVLPGQDAWRIAQRRVHATARRTSAGADDMTDGGDGDEGAPVAVGDEDVEVPPKWVFLRQALHEVQSQDPNAPVLVLARDTAAVRQLSEMLRMGPEQYLRVLYGEWRTAQMAMPAATPNGDHQIHSPHSYRGRGRGGGRGRGSPRGAKSRVNPAHVAPAVAKQPRLTPGKRGAPPPAGAKGTLPTLVQQRRVEKRILNADTEIEVIELSEDNNALERQQQEESEVIRLASDEGGYLDLSDRSDQAPMQACLLTHNVYVRTNATCRHELASVEPRYVVIFDVDLAVLRTLECFRAARPSIAMRLYVFLYGDSADEVLHTEALKKEDDAFAALILEKSKLVLPPSVIQAPALATETELPSSMRNAAAPVRVAEPHIIVDTRELRPGIALPSLLQLRGAVLHAVSLDSGDYVLTPELCIERKAVPDLIGSFADGRLFTQTERLSRLYKRPVLLIEGAIGQPFSLHGNEEITDELNHSDVSAKLVLLCMHFPQLRVLWSRDAHHTAELFMALKRGASEPDVRAVKSTEELHESRGNEVPQDILRRLPGVSRAGLRSVTDQVSNLRSLSECTVDQLEPLLHSRADAVRMHAFWEKNLRAAAPPASASNRH